MSQRDCVLIVDDEPDLNEIIGVVFARHGLEVLLASTFEEGVEKARQCGLPVTAVVTDLNMPGGDGDALLFRLLELGAPIRAVAIMTGFIDADRYAAVQAAFSAGVVSVFTKPFLRSALVEWVMSKLSTPVLKSDDSDLRSRPQVVETI